MKPPEPTEAQVQAALAAIVARPETRLGDAIAWATYDHLLGLQRAGESPETVTLALLPFLAARRRLLADVADVHLLG